MCNINCILFGAKNLTKNEVKDKRIIELGSYDVNGSLRTLIESFGPSKYIGIDLKNGPGVDLICDVKDLIKKFGEESFDIVISTEMLEHIKDWRDAISKIKHICKPGGIILITTRSKGFKYHSYPHDFWRYEPKDIKYIFSDCNISVLERDDKEPGIFTKIRKPKKFIEKNLLDYKLYNIIANRRVLKIENKFFRTIYYFKLVLKEKIKETIKFIIK